MTHDATSDERPKNTHASPAPAATACPAASSRRRPKHDYLWWLAGPFNKARNEQAMWISVIAQALMDALSRSQTPEAKYFRREAQDWLIGMSQDFIIVCDHAGMEPCWVRKMAKRVMIARTRWRAEPRQGARYQERKAYREHEREKKRKEKAKPEPAPGCLIIHGPWGKRL